MKKGSIYKKALQILCFTLLVSSLAGCVSSDYEADDSKEEPVVLTMFVENQSRYTGIQEDPVADYIEERFGIRIKLTTDATLDNASSGEDAYRELLKNKLSSNDLADIMDFGPALEDKELMEMLQKSAQSGLLLPLDGLIKKHAPNIQEDERLSLRNEYRRKEVYEDGNLYSLGSQGGTQVFALPPAAAWIRWDLYSELRYPSVSTDEELLELLMRMQSTYPETPGGDKVYALGLPGAADGTWKKMIVRDYPMSKGYEPIDGSSAVYLNHAQQKIESPLAEADSFFWSGVELYYEANQLGLLDPESPSLGFSEYEKKINKGVYLLSFDGTQVDGKEQILAGKGMKAAGYVPLGALADTKAVLLYKEEILGGRDLAVTSSCKHPDLAVEFLDWCLSEEGSRILSQGAEGLAWEEEHGEYSLTEQYKKDATLGITDLAEKYGKEKYEGLSGFLPLCKDRSGNYIQIEETLEDYGQSAVVNDALRHYGIDDFAECFTEGNAGSKQKNTQWTSYLKLMGEKPEEINGKLEALNLLVEQSVMECIYAENREEFDLKKTQVMREAKRLGVDQVKEWYAKRLVKIREEVDPLLE